MSAVSGSRNDRSTFTAVRRLLSSVVSHSCAIPDPQNEGQGGNQADGRQRSFADHLLDTAFNHAGFGARDADVRGGGAEAATEGLEIASYRVKLGGWSSEGSFDG